MGMEHWWNGTDRGKLKYWVWSIGGMVLTGESWSAGTETCIQSAILCTTKLKGTDLGSNPSHRRKKTATKRLRAI